MIFYFSGAGNSRWAAETISVALGDTLCTIGDKVLKGDTIDIKDGERIGIVCPVHGWMPPMIVRKFVSLLHAKGKHYCFCVMTAGDSIGEAMHILKNDMEMVGLTLDAAFTLIMPESYVCLPFFYTDKPLKEQCKIERATRDLIQYIEDIKKEKSVKHLKKGFFPIILTYVLGIPFNRMLITDKPFRVDTERCLHCGLCAKVCPVGNIVMRSDSTPMWKRCGLCTNCMACYHHCPAHAINHWTTKNKGQYTFKNNKPK
ncbi:MAG: EFR1 family ferrodoxin [Prevotella sp.]|nr:EFR1 family ferrodoxin [Candidatus Equicola faecalis]